MRRRRAAVTVAGGAALLAVAGCSSGTVIGTPAAAEASKSATTIFNDSIATLRAAQSVHLKGPLAGIYFDADLGGGNFSGTANSGGKVFSIVYLADPGGDRTKARIFIKAPATVWATAASPAIASCVGDRWLTLDPASLSSGGSTPQGVAQLAVDAGQLGNLAGFADALGNSPGALTKGAEAPFNGTDVIAIQNSSGAVIFVATQGPPYILRISGVSNGQGQTLDFTSWNGGAHFSAPGGATSLNSVLATCPGVPSPSSSPAATPTP